MAKKRARGVVKSAGRGGSTQVMAKVQGEGDYASARRYNSETRKFVKAKGAAAPARQAVAWIGPLCAKRAAKPAMTARRIGEMRSS